MYLIAIDIADFILISPNPAIPTLPADRAPNEAPYRCLGSYD